MLFQIHMLHQDCNSLRQGLQLARERLQEEEERAARLEQKCVQLEAELGTCEEQPPVPFSYTFILCIG